MFGIANSDTLNTNTEYAFTFDASYKILGLVPGWQPSDVEVKNDLRSRFLEGDLISVSRGLGSGRYVIVIKPYVLHDLDYWIETFNAIFNDAGYKSKFVDVERGKSSSEPGGVRQVISETTQVLTNITGDTIGILFKKFWPYIAGTIVVIGGYLYVYGRATGVFKKNPKRRIRRKK